MARPPMDAVVRRDLRCLWHPCTQMKDHESHPPVRIVRGRGSWLYDARGRRYLDAVSSWWVNLFGHGHPRLVRALTRQARRLDHVLFAGFTHDPAVDCAEALLRAAPRGLSRVFYADNGSSAVEAALKMSFHYWRNRGERRDRFLALSGGYHGETLGALGAGGIDLYRKTYRPLLMKAGFARAPSCGACPFGKERASCGAECFVFVEDRVRRMGPDRIAGVIVEPLVQCANRMNMFPPAWLARLRAFCTKQRIHLIADEIAVGFGRTGTLFACEQARVCPDLLCLSKGITGGVMPFSALLTREEIYGAFYADYSEGKAFLHSHSYTGNPLGCALALETLRIFREEGILEKMAPAVAAMDAALTRCARHPAVRRVRRTGLIGAFDLVHPRTGRDFPVLRRTGLAVTRACFPRGILLRPLGDTIYFMPPLTVSEREMDGLGRTVRRALDGVIG